MNFPTKEQFDSMDPLTRIVWITRLEAWRKARNKIDGYFPEEDAPGADGNVLYHARAKYPKHLNFFRAGLTYRERGVLAANRVGKALRHGTRIATPSGWKFIEDVRIGDQVIAGDGSITRVVGVYPQGEVDLYDLSMDGKHTITTCGEHLWKYLPPAARYPTRQDRQGIRVNPRYGQWKVGNTREIATLTSKNPRQRCVVPMAKPFGFPHADLPLHPYLLGVILGDGSVSQGCATISTPDDEIIDICRSVMPVNTRLTAYSYKAGKCPAYGFASIKLKGFGGAREANPVVAALRKLELTGHRSETKFIPPAYLYADAESRLALLRGLMDTDGSISGVSRAMEYSTTSDRLAEDFCWLAASLGMKARKIHRHTKDQHGNGLPSWRIVLRSGKTCPFLFSRKASRWAPLQETSDWVVHSVKPAGRGLATCIEVDHPSHTFVIEHGVVTHNTESMGLYEVAHHLMGDYPDWWPGRMWKRPTNWIVAGKSNESTRDILQTKLFGKVINRPDGTRTLDGLGLIRGDCIGRLTWKSGFPNLLDSAEIKHKSGALSLVVLRSYEQGRKAFEGTERDGVLLDEEPPFEVWGECLIRTATTNGMVIGTFTPLDGITETVRHFLPTDLMTRLQGDEATPELLEGVVEVSPSRCMIMIGWDDVPHLDEKTKSELLDGTPPHLRKARSKGIPSLGDGAIFPVDEESIKCAPFEIPAHWPRICGLDFGWDHPTAACWLAYDRETDTIYLYAEYAASRTVIPVHASAIKGKGAWIPVAWPHDGYQVKDQTNGEQLADQYRKEQVAMLPEHAQFLPTPGSKEKVSVVSVEAGIQEMLTRMTSGRWKVFSTCTGWLEEFRIYRRENGQIVKLVDDRISASRYAMMSLRFAKTLAEASPRTQHRQRPRSGKSWMIG